MITLTFLMVTGLWLTGADFVIADWWERPPARPTVPVIERDRLPTPTEVPPTTQPTTTQPSPTSPPTGELPTPTNVPSDGRSGGTSEDACASGKSYTGLYCGWSPSVEGAGVGEEAPRIGGPQVLGLSKTSGEDLALSDIIFLSGVLCLALYLRSKLSKVIL